QPVRGPRRGRGEQRLGAEVVDDDRGHQATAQRGQRDLTPGRAVGHRDDLRSPAEAVEVDAEDPVAELARALPAVAVEEPAADLADRAEFAQPRVVRAVEHPPLGEHRVVQGPEADQREVERGELAPDEADVLVVEEGVPGGPVAGERRGVEGEEGTAEALRHRPPELRGVDHPGRGVDLPHQLDDANAGDAVGRGQGADQLTDSAAAGDTDDRPRPDQPRDHRRGEVADRPPDARRAPPPGPDHHRVAETEPVTEPPFEGDVAGLEGGDRDLDDPPRAGGGQQAGDLGAGDVEDRRDLALVEVVEVVEPGGRRHELRLRIGHRRPSSPPAGCTSVHGRMCTRS
ncbi:MAG: hypothetical protein AVDCRST_MAG49-3787, partial [uncultured Thermomicrobiales bacterium]